MLFIDTNIYLDFYRVVRMRSLLQPLVDLHPHVFVTKQVVREFHRQKANVAAAFVAEQFKGIGTTNLSVPDAVFQGVPIAEQLERLNAEAREKEQALRALKNEILVHTLSNLSTSTDAVSRGLEPVFSEAREPTSEQIQRARWRREVGDPPGKKSDPLGDQLTWEQLLDNIDENGVWIVSRDGDYSISQDKSVFINPLLLKELREREAHVQVHCFTSLAEGIKAYQTVAAVQLPENDELARIEEAERQLPVVTQMDPLRPFSCPGCEAVETFEGPFGLRSRYGGITLQYVCSKCRFHYDTAVDWE